MATDKVSMKCAFSLALNRSGIYQLIYTERMVILGKLVDSVSIKFSSLYNQAVEVIYTVCQEAAVAPGVGFYYPNYTGQ